MKKLMIWFLASVILFNCDKAEEPPGLSGLQLKEITFKKDGKTWKDKYYYIGDKLVQIKKTQGLGELLIFEYDGYNITEIKYL